MPTQATERPCRLAASAKRIGNRPLPARRPILWSTEYTWDGREKSDLRPGSTGGTARLPPLKAGRVALGLVAGGQGRGEGGHLGRQLAELLVHLGQPRGH